MSSERINHACEVTVTQLPNGLYLEKGVADVWTVFYPASVVDAIVAATDERLRQAKHDSGRWMDEAIELREKVAATEATTASRGVESAEVKERSNDADKARHAALLQEMWHAVGEWERLNQENNKVPMRELGLAYERAQSASDALGAELSRARASGSSDRE